VGDAHRAHRGVLNAGANVHRGGWAASYGDETMVGKLGERLRELTGGKHAWLFGHRTYRFVVRLERSGRSIQGAA
jgi:hypothetical protein